MFQFWPFPKNQGKELTEDMVKSLLQESTSSSREKVKAACKLNEFVNAVNTNVAEYAQDFIIGDIDLKAKIEEQLGRTLLETEVRQAIDLAEALKAYLNERTLSRLLEKFDQEDKSALAHELNTKLRESGLQYPHSCSLDYEVLLWKQDVGEDEADIEGEEKAVRLSDILQHVLKRKLTEVEMFKVDILQQAFEHQQIRGIIMS